MIPLQIILDVERDQFPDFPGEEVRKVHPDGEPWLVTGIGLLRHGTQKGNAVVFVKVTLPDGSHAIAQTTWKLLRTAVDGLKQSPIALEEVEDP